MYSAENFGREIFRAGVPVGLLMDLLDPVGWYASSGSLAQLAEQRTLNPWVRGSSPRRPTSNPPVIPGDFYIYA